MTETETQGRTAKSAEGTQLATLAHVGGSKRRIETEFETEKSDLWLDG